MNINKILNYEKKRNSIEELLFNESNISIDELIILLYIKNFKQDVIDLKIFKEELIKNNIDSQKFIKTLNKKGFFSKRRNSKDERQVELYDFDIIRINNILDIYESLINIDLI